MIVDPTIVRLTLRGLLGRKRVWFLLPLPALLVLLALLASLLGADVAQWGGSVLRGFGLGVMLPITALIIGTSVLGSEIDDGTAVHLLAKPIPRPVIVLSKLLTACGLTVATAAVPLLLVGLVGGGVRFGLALFAGATLAAVVYSALFVLLGVVTRRPVALGLLYVLLWEGLLANFASGTKALSAQHYALAVTDSLSGGDILGTDVSPLVAAVMSLVLLVGSTALAIRRLTSFNLTGETG